MASIPLHPRQKPRFTFTLNPLPQFLQTPTGLALLELQGTINLPQVDPTTLEDGTEIGEHGTPIGSLDFPDYKPDYQDLSSTAWMKCVYLYVGPHQRLQGEVKKLPKAIAIIKRREPKGLDTKMTESEEGEASEELEVVEIVKYKLVFSQRPEPVGT